LPQHPNKSIPAVPARAGVSEHLARHHCQAERVIEFAICEQSGIRSDHRSTKLERQFAVEIEPENFAVRFTRPVAVIAAFKLA
jgi:hypothetical protein